MSKKAEVKKSVKDTKSEKQAVTEKLAAIEKKETEDCAKKVQAALDEFGCIAIVSGRFSGNQCESGISIVKKK